jgi:hypothetical protein
MCARALRTAPDAAGERRRRGLCRALAAHVPLVCDAPRSFFDCLVDCFGKPLRRFNAGAARRAPQRLAAQGDRVAHTRAQVCYVLDSWLRHYASDFIADSELFADSRSCWWQRAEVEVARQMALAARAGFVLVRPSELTSRAWMKDAADVHARDCPNIKRIIKPVQPHQPLGGVGKSARHRRRADAP